MTGGVVVSRNESSCAGLGLLSIVEVFGTDVASVKVLPERMYEIIRYAGDSNYHVRVDKGDLTFLRGEPNGPVSPCDDANEVIRRLRNFLPADVGKTVDIRNTDGDRAKCIVPNATREEIEEDRNVYKIHFHP
ncbi:hypothetical protein GNI_077400 [Gregarina niphandrodes]|uniref:Uncharacterized protein n=1 Tax=Gregarina niphandrodes TaxID=110365 RepID=A0A023B6Q3_GRENI|nr:hypothetical protein GNI_077400 [Gregarina niphandrodes]EZG66694.1 hypothetical protein GNI_077400 [Gregarina niphandrodes]|eukprot:XP_011130521.1 hypothetical protein GNI_077400 [Gregarina niphandrodes]